MAQLDRHPQGLKMRELSERLMVTGGNVTGLTHRLVAEGLVERRDDAIDGRAITVRLTAEGKRQFRTMAAEHEGWIAELMGGMKATVLEMDRGMGRGGGHARPRKHAAHGGESRSREAHACGWDGGHSSLTIARTAVGADAPGRAPRAQPERGTTCRGKGAMIGTK
jgi:DNA-binding PadR family transcriptional regulator